MASRRRRKEGRSNEPETVPGSAKPGVGLGDIVAILIACVLVVWRAQSYPIAKFWHDWIVIVSAYWIFTIVGGKSRAWPFVTVGVMFFLLGVFAWGNLPKVLGMYDWAP